MKKIPVEVSAITVNGEKRLVPKVPLAQLMLPGSSAEAFDQKALNRYGEGYLAMIERCRGILKAIRTERAAGRRASPILFWCLGDEIVTFLQGEGPFALSRLYWHLTRDMGFSRTSLKACLRFRRSVPNLRRIDVSRTWWHYREAPKAELAVKARTRRAASP